MSILNPEHLIEQADRLIAAPSAGPPRQVDLRRAISAAYYALFHLTLTALADEMVGTSRRGTLRYGLLHRSADHRAIKDLCVAISKATPPQKYTIYLLVHRFGRDLLAFVEAFTELQDKRLQADYDVTARFFTVDARSAIATARSGIMRFKASDPAEMRMFLTLLLCPPR